MQVTWSHLLLAFGLAAPLVTASLNGTVAIISPTPTTMATMISANPNATHFLDGVTVLFDPIPTTRPTLSVTYGQKAAKPSPGSVIILNGIPHRVLSDTIKEDTPVLPDEVDPPGVDLYQPWNTSYPGPIKDGDWAKYLQIWDPVWWSLNLDSIRQTSCHCSADDFYTNPQAQLAAYSNFVFYSHQLGNVYSLDWGCGPVQSSMTINERITSAKHLSEHCWSAAGGEFPDYSQAHTMKEYFCDAKEELCVRPWRDGKRSLKFHDHKRNYDREGVHTWSEIQQIVTDVCTPICRDRFQMNYDDFSQHDPSFITSFYPPKPIDETVVGD